MCVYTKNVYDRILTIRIIAVVSKHSKNVCSRQVRRATVQARYASNPGYTADRSPAAHTGQQQTGHLQLTQVNSM